MCVCLRVCLGGAKWDNKTRVKVGDTARIRVSLSSPLGPYITLTLTPNP